MKKEDVLSHLQSAKSAHIKWLDKAKLLINGLDLQDSIIPIDSKECSFGKWFYGDGQKLKSLSNNPLECMQNMEELHFNFHDKYLNIFNIYFADTKKAGFFSKLVGSKKRKVINEEETFLAESYHIEMKMISQNLIEEINRLERRLTAVSNEKIESLGQNL